MTQQNSTLTPAAFLIRGLLVGLVAGVVTFAMAYFIGEPHVETAIALEESAHTHGEGHHHGDGIVEHDHGDGVDHSHGEAVEVSRSTQSTWGLLGGTLAVAVALGGLVALAAAVAIGRLGTLTARQTTALVSLAGFVSVAVLPFLKYPANPPAVGDPDTIGSRTATYFALLAASVIAAGLACWLATRLWRRYGGFNAGVIAAAAYVAVAGGFALLLPAAADAGAFPADTLWSFRVASLLTQTAMWAVLGVGLTALIGRLHDQARADTERREFAASL